MKAVLVLLDSLNRHMLDIYNPASWASTPNIQRLAKQSVVFDNHWLGSAPCMPARRDIFTGRLNFLERNWGPIEPFDITLQETLKKNGTFCHIVTDHTHYFEIGGENYCQLFSTWDVQRGQEFDPWISRVNPPDLPDQYYGKASVQYELNRSVYYEDSDYPSPRTFASACDWIHANKDADNFFLMVEAFDPHEPFDCPQEFLDLYNDDYSGPRYDWSGYQPVTEPEEATKHLQKRYAATLTMADKWLGKLMDALEQADMWEDTLFVLTTDHGHLLGEHGWTGKNKMHVYNELAHLPFVVHLPGGEQAGRRVAALTQNIDLMPTLLEYFGIEKPWSMHGHSLGDILKGSPTGVRDTALYGWHGRTVNITDERYTYFRGPAQDDNRPCFAYCAMPTTLWRYMGTNNADEIEMGRFLAHTDFPVYKIPVHGEVGAMGEISHIRTNLLFDIHRDYQQLQPIVDKTLEKNMVHKLIAAMKAHGAPDEQYARLGLDV
jgi:arylsulfatase A-like enzyme